MRFGRSWFILVHLKLGKTFSAENCRTFLFSFPDLQIRIPLFGNLGTASLSKAPSLSKTLTARLGTAHGFRVRRILNIFPQHSLVGGRFLSFPTRFETNFWDRLRAAFKKRMEHAGFTVFRVCPGRIPSLYFGSQETSVGDFRCCRLV